jgi:hypothetical protein
MSLPEIARAFAEFLQRNRRDHALIGAFALYAYGYVRATRDIDFVVRLSDREPIQKFLVSLGFETTYSSDAFSNHLHPVGGVRLDLMYVDSVTADQIFTAATTRAVFQGVSLPVVCPEHLLAMKLFSASNNAERRLKDLGDAAEVVRRTALDREMVLGYCKKYGMEAYFEEIAGPETQEPNT